MLLVLRALQPPIFAQPSSMVMWMIIMTMIILTMIVMRRNQMMITLSGVVDGDNKHDQ